MRGSYSILRRIVPIIRQGLSHTLRYAHSKPPLKRAKPQSHPLTPPRSIRQQRLPSRGDPAPTVYTQTNLKVAIIGRPNVGKSTLFNRLASAVRGRGNEGSANPSPLVFVRSVVDSVPGVTRDPRESSAALSDFLFSVVDTPGLESAVGDPVSFNVPDKKKSIVGLANASALCDDPIYRDMYRLMEAATVKAVEKADVIFFVVDAADGVTSIDHAISTWLRTALAGSSKQVLVVANKCDVADSEKRVLEAYALGFGDPLVLSAEQGLGFADLYAELDRLFKNVRGDAEPIQSYDNPWKRKEDDPEPHDPELEESRASYDDELVVGCNARPGEEPLQQLVVSIIGRPNVGKSTLINRLAGEERSLVGPTAGVTRDAVLCEWKLSNTMVKKGAIPIWLVDTAGVRAQMKVIDEPLELLSVKTSLRALRHSHIVLMIMDAVEPLCQQDMKLLDLVVAHGRAAVLVINKIDQLKEDNMDEWRLGLRYRVDKKVTELAGVEVVEVSAKNWEEDPAQMTRLHAAVERARIRWERRIPTAQLNRFVTRFNERMAVGGGTRSATRNRIGVTKFITQKKIRPPMFRLDGSSAVSMNYLRSLTNAIRLEFGFQGVPVRLKRPSRQGRK